MCGLVGFLDFVNQNPLGNLHAVPSGKSKQKALNTLEDRGPDDKGEWQDQHIWLGHRRLSIVDTTSRATNLWNMEILSLRLTG